MDPSEQLAFVAVLAFDPRVVAWERALLGEMAHCDTISRSFEHNWNSVQTLVAIAARHSLRVARLVTLLCHMVFGTVIHVSTSVMGVYDC